MTIYIRKATSDDLPAINRVIGDAAMNWPMAKRVKRLSVPLLTYTETDLDFYEVLVAEIQGQVIGIAAWDPANNQSLPNGPGGLFHGLYVLPLVQGQGVGEALMNAVFSEAKLRQCPGLLVKAERISCSYFDAHQLERLAANDSEYPYQYWKRLA